MSDFDAAVREATESLAEDVGVDDDARAAPMEEAVDGVAESLEDLTTQEPAGDLAAEPETDKEATEDEEESDPVVERFLDWFDAFSPHDFFERSVVPARDAYGGWRLVTTRAVEAGEEMLKSAVRPQCLVMGTHAFAKSFVKAGCSERGAMAAYLLLERLKVSGSLLQPWLAMLPSTADVAASGLGMSDAAATGDGDLVALLEKARNAEAKDFAAACAHLEARGTLHERPLPEGFDAAGFAWAFRVIWSRAVNAGGFRSLVSLADFANHDPRSDQAIGRVDAGRDSYFTIKAARAHAAGEEVCISYGHKTHREYLIHYGFVPLDAALVPDEGGDRSAARLAAAAFPSPHALAVRPPRDERRREVLAYYGVGDSAPGKLTLSTHGRPFLPNSDAWAVARVASLPDDRLPPCAASDGDESGDDGFQGAAALFRIEDSGGAAGKDALGRAPADDGDRRAALRVFLRACVAELDDAVGAKPGVRDGGAFAWPLIYAAARQTALRRAVAALEKECGDDAAAAAGLTAAVSGLRL